MEIGPDICRSKLTLKARIQTYERCSLFIWSVEGKQILVHQGSFCLTPMDAQAILFKILSTDPIQQSTSDQRLLTEWAKLFAMGYDF